MKLSHGNTMTAAAVCANVIQIVGGKSLDRKVFLTGATTKVGSAVALYLANRGFDVVCYTSSEERFQEMKAKLNHGAKGRLVMVNKLQDGNAIATWIVGKYDPEVNDNIPEGGEAVVFAMPSPMNDRKRPDLHITFGKSLRRRGPLWLCSNISGLCACRCDL